MSNLRKAAILSSTSLGALMLAALPVSLVTSTSAYANCTLTQGAGVSIICEAEFDADLTFSEPLQTLLLEQPPEPDQSAIIDFSGDDAIMFDTESILAEEPPAGTIPFGEIVFARDESCQPGEVLRITGGNNSEGIPRQRECVLNELEVFTEAGTGPLSPVERFLDLGAGDDVVTIDSGRLVGTILGGLGNDSYFVGPDAEVFLDPLAAENNGVAFVGGAGNDTIEVAGGNELFFRLSGDAGDDVFIIAGTVGVPQNPDFDQTDPVGLSAGSGNDMITLESGSLISGIVDAGTGNDILDINAGTVPFDNDDGVSVVAGLGNDSITIGSAAVLEDVIADALSPSGEEEEFTDDDTIALQFGGQVGSILAGRGDDTITSAGIVLGSIVGGEGSDDVTINNGRVANVLGDDAFDGDGDFGGDGESGAVDTLTFTGGGITGDVSGFETITVDETLSEAAITDLPLTVTGLDTTLNINNTDLAERSLEAETELSGIGTLTLDQSTLGLGDDDQGIALLRVLNNSTLLIDGLVGLSLSETDGLPTGDLEVQGSRLSLLDGDPTDVLGVNTFTFDNSTLAIDVNPNTADSDAIVVAQTAGTSFVGENTLEVNLTEPVAEPGVLIPVVSIVDEPTPDDEDPSLEDFLVVGVGDNIDPLLGLSLVQGSGGGLFLRTDEEGVVAEAPNIVNTTTTLVATDAVRDVNTDILDNEVGFTTATAAARQQISPIFGIFANGSFGRINHDGFDVSGEGGANAVTPGFTSDNFSLIVTGEADATALLGLEDEDIGVKLSVFGGYVLSDVTLDRNVAGLPATPFEGSGRNEGGVLGASALASRIVGEGILNYGLISAAGFLGNTEVVNAETNGEGDYDTQGFVVSARVGRNIPLDDRFRLDLRFGASYAGFYGDSFVDDQGTRFGDSETSYGLLSFEPGISTNVLAGNTVISPTARMLFHHRFAYENSASVNDFDFDFDDADFSIGGQVGANARFTDRLSGGAFIEGRVSEDQRSVLGKLAIKYTFSQN